MKVLRQPPKPVKRDALDEALAQVDDVKPAVVAKAKPAAAPTPTSFGGKPTEQPQVIARADMPVASSNLGWSVDEKPARLGVTADDEKRIGEATKAWAALTPKALADGRAAVSQVLGGQRTAGSSQTTLEKLGASGLTKEQQALVLDTLSLASSYYDRVAASTDDPVAKATQAANKTHLFGEVDQLCDAARALKLSPKDLSLAMLSATYSDMVKIGGRLKMGPDDQLASMKSLMNHDLAGAAAAEAFMAKDPRLSKADRAAVVDGIRAHQYTPPAFFANMLGVTARFSMKLAGYTPTPADEQTLASLKQKVASPYEHLMPGTNRVAFSTDEKKLMRDWVGREDWVVPNDPAQHAVAGADVLDNYGSPGGMLKYPRFRGPGTTFQDGTLKDSLGTVYPKFDATGQPVFDKAAYAGPPHGGNLPSCVDAYWQLPEALRPVVAEKLVAARTVMTDAFKRMESTLRAQGHDPAQVPFWGKPLTPADYADLQRMQSDPPRAPGRLAELKLAVEVKELFIAEARKAIEATGAP
ncbi:MAG: hypothetical protein JNK82_02005 [Myxococcaceae bacterium]|nr:hypothetical protein [Myxococcaceae bacterium]